MRVNSSCWQQLRKRYSLSVFRMMAFSLKKKTYPSREVPYRVTLRRWPSKLSALSLSLSVLEFISLDKLSCNDRDAFCQVTAIHDQYCLLSIDTNSS
jgi:hypothetical protein